MPRLQTSLFRRYFTVLFLAVVVPLLTAGLSEAWLGYRDQRARLDDLLDAESRLAAITLRDFVNGIRDQMAWTVQLPWSDKPDDNRRLDASRLMRQVPAVTSVRLIDQAGRERLFVSRFGLNRVEAGIDCLREPGFSGARESVVWYSPVTFHRDTEPFMTIAVAGRRAAAGVVEAEINLKLILDVISAIHVGKTGGAFVLDRPGRLIAHPDISLVLRGVDDPAVEPLRLLRTAIQQRRGHAATGQDWAKRATVAAMAPVPGPDWSVLVHQPFAEAFYPIYVGLRRMLFLLVGGTLLAGGLAYWQADRMSGPIRQLEHGADRIGAGHFNHRINIARGDELGRLADRLNAMAGELAVSQDRSERIDRLKRFLAPQVAELVDQTGSDTVLDARRMEVVVIFIDLRGFTSFAARTEPDEIMAVLSEYYEALSACIMKHGATLTNLSGDGLMVLVNAPIACADPALQALRLSLEMRAVGQSLVSAWSMRGHRLGFGIGVALGPATVGQIGAQSRLDYTAIGHVVNLASRLCANAAHGQILIDAAAAAAVETRACVGSLGCRYLKGIDEAIPVYEVKVPDEALTCATSLPT